MDAYKGVFSVLDELNMPDLKPVFLQHFIQDRTLQYIETEEEFKHLLREIEIPLGRCIPIIKLLSKLSAQKDAPDVTQGSDMLNITSPYSIQTSDAEVQAVAEMNDVETQTSYNNEADPVQHYPTGPMSAGYGQPLGQELFNPYHLLGQMSNMGLAMNNMQPPPMSAADMRRFVQFPQAPQVYTTPPMWGTYAQPPVSEDLGTSGWLAAGLLYQGGPIITSLSRETSPCPSPPLPSEPVDYAAEVNGNKEPPKAIGQEKGPDILDEREDQAIEQFLVAEERQQSYASKLKEKQLAAKANEITVKENTKASHNHYPPPQSPRTHSPAASSNNTPSSNSTNHIKAPVVRHKERAGSFGKIDEISVESGTCSKNGENFKNVGSASLKAYLEQVLASHEYIEASQKRDHKKGWLAIDGKHIMSARKIQFKPVYCDEKGRMRHGVSVRGADKSEECSRHTVGKAPAYCTFAHSRIGDTLQCICVKCTVEKPRYTFCQDKKKHCEYIFNLGPYKNIDGQVWKLI